MLFKFLVLFCCTFGLIYCSPSYETQKIESEPVYEARPYKFGYEINDGYNNKQYFKENSDSNNVKQGSFGYLDSQGIYRHTTYVADDKGFRVKINSNEPGLAAQKQLKKLSDLSPDSGYSSSPIIQQKDNAYPAYEQNNNYTPQEKYDEQQPQVDSRKPYEPIQQEKYDAATEAPQLQSYDKSQNESAAPKYVQQIKLEEPRYETPEYQAPIHNENEQQVKYDNAQYDQQVKYEEQKYEAPKYEMPKYEQQVKYEAPKYEAPRYEMPKYEAPKYEEPKYEQQVKYEAPKYEAAKYEMPKYEAPKYEAPKYEEPKYEAPKLEKPASYEQQQHQITPYAHSISISHEAQDRPQQHMQMKYEDSYNKGYGNAKYTVSKSFGKNEDCEKNQPTGSQYNVPQSHVAPLKSPYISPASVLKQKHQQSPNPSQAAYLSVPPSYQSKPVYMPEPQQNYRLQMNEKPAIAARPSGQYSNYPKKPAFTSEPSVELYAPTKPMRGSNSYESDNGHNVKYNIVGVALERLRKLPFRLLHSNDGEISQEMQIAYAEKQNELEDQAANIYEQSQREDPSQAKTKRMRKPFTPPSEGESYIGSVYY